MKNYSMKKTDKMKYFLGLLYNSTFMPIHYYVGESLELSLPFEELPEDLVSSYKYSLTHRNEDVYYIATKEFLYIGIIRNRKTGEFIIVGPVSNIQITSDTVDQLIKDYSLPSEQKSQIEDFFVRTPIFSIGQFLNILTLINKELNNEFLDIGKTFNIYDENKEKSVAEKHADDLYERKENENYHDTYLFEKEYYGFVQRGDIDGLKEFLGNVPPITEGKIAADSLRQAKNIFIASIAIITRKAAEGGLDVETAYQLSDSYIQEVEKMTSASSITLLNATAAMDFTKRVSEAKIPADMSMDIYKAIQFISNHVNKNISAADVADYLGMERSTLSKKFKRELGFNISAFITRKKLEEAKSLLHHSDRTISEISEYLCFSSQSYFQNVFKAKYGMTPKEFRRSKSSPEH